MQFTIDIPDGSEELQELLDCVADNNNATPPNPITLEEYVTNIITGWLANRVMETYIHHVRQQTPETLRGKFGQAKNLRR